MIRNSFIYIVTSGIGQIFGFFSIIIMAHSLTQSDMGSYYFVISISGIVVGVSLFGLNQGISREYSNKSVHFAEIYRAGLTISIFSILSITCLLVVLSIGQFMKMGFLELAFILVYSISNVIMAYELPLIAMMKTPKILPIVGLFSGLSGLFILIFFLDYGLLGAFISAASVAAISVALLAAFLHGRNPGAIGLNSRGNIERVRPFLKYSTANFLPSMMGQFQINIIVMIIGLFSTMSNIASFSFPQSIAQVIAVVSSSFSTAFLAEACSNPESAQQLRRKALLSALKILMAVVVIGILFGPILISLINSNYGGESGVIFRILVLATIPSAIIENWINMRKFQKDSKALIVYSLIDFSITISLSIILGILIGIAGIALGLLISKAGLALYLFCLDRRRDDHLMTECDV